MPTHLVPVTIGQFTGRDLHELFAPVLAHAATDPEVASIHPGLTVIACEIERGVFYAAGSDRYTLGITRRQLPDDQPATEGDIAVPATLLRRVLAGIRRRDKVTMDMDSGGLTITLADEIGLTFRIPASPLPFLIPWRTFLGDKLRATGTPLTSPVMLNPSLLTRFNAATRGGLPLELRRVPGDDRAPVLVICGSHFVGLIAPMSSQPQSMPPGWDPDAEASWFTACPARDVKPAPRRQRKVA
ncbi:hypothetical protein OIE66_30680 [Nonomuraea sp. NBC_01738]|uniref:hypothetical protein n=1 Tax=Nonomuraea sp. NBC_01738 TaxID=2976003 RepID=UPI002E0FB7CD|nr:hypothetical protein OIE66_30680 [Nonomuraea sp. NBC_01738]